MAKYSYPSVRTTEIDNSIINNTTPSLGVGAIVFKSNKGPVNQRFLTSSYSNFTNLFGEPENLDDYGHFAADNFLAVSNQLYCVRATMGDEGYAQIQFPYTDAEVKDCYVDANLSEFKYINNEDDNKLNLLSPLNTITTISGLINEGEWLLPERTETSDSLSSFYLYQKAQFSTINDLINDDQPSIAVFKNVGSSLDVSAIEKENGVYVEFPTKVSDYGQVIKKFDDLILTEDAWTTGSINVKSFIKSNTPVFDEITSAKGYKVNFSIPGTDTLNGKAYPLTAYFDEEFINSWETKTEIEYGELFNESSFYHGGSTATFVTTAQASKIQFLDWDDCIEKTYYVNKEYFENHAGQAGGIQFREYGFNDLQEALIAINDTYDMNLEEIPMDKLAVSSYATVSRLADEYGADATELAGTVNGSSESKYTLLKYYDVWNGIQVDENNELLNEPIEKVVYTKEWKEFKNKLTSDNNFNENLFWVVAEVNKTKPTTISTYVQELPNNVVIPWQQGKIYNINGKEEQGCDKITALSTSEVLNSTNEKYRDGYTLNIESDYEPGNGDIEQYSSNRENQLIIAAFGPGEWGNDIGISIITPECEAIPVLNHHNAFDWKNRYEDEDLVDKDDDDVLTWKKVYRINVYVKNKTKTAENAWGTGMDALLKDPVEYFYVSNDPTAKDNNGNSLYAPNVINGHSNYIYVSRNSVNESKTGAGTYAMPRQTYAIYQLTGGTNSKKNNMTEKTAALKLYADRQKLDFDILFNVEAIDTFNGRQRYQAHQKKIADIAGSRKVDIGVVQVTSLDARTIKRQLSEAKMFSFNNGSYVAQYAGYDKYYNDSLASYIYLPKSVAGACAMAFCDNYARPWFAPAGQARGGISYSFGQVTRLSDDEIGQLYNINVNTSRQCGSFGEILWGQKTALKQESALNRINVRRCLNYITKRLELMLSFYIFKQNTPNTRSSAKNTIDAFLSRVQAGEGIVKYELSVTEDNQDPHIMNVNISLVPAESIEFIDIKINITREGVFASIVE